MRYLTPIICATLGIAGFNAVILISCRFAHVQIEAPALLFLSMADLILWVAIAVTVSENQE